MALDDKGFVLTSAATATAAARWRPAAPGVFAIGDVRVRLGQARRAAVGEGAQVVAALHAFLGEPAAKT